MALINMRQLMAQLADPQVCKRAGLRIYMDSRVITLRQQPMAWIHHVEPPRN
jgi:hypothetical protein